MKERSDNFEITKVEDLPFIPERIRVFAYNYALQPKKQRKVWAKEYGISVRAVESWLRHAGVRDYVAILRSEARENTDHGEEIRRKMEESHGGKRVP